MDVGICIASHINDIDYVVRAEELGYSRVLDEEALAPSTLLATVTEMLDELPALRAKLEDFQPLDSVTLIAEAIRKAAN